MKCWAPNAVSSLQADWQLACVMLGGLNAQGAAWLAQYGPDELNLELPVDLANAGVRQRILRGLRARGFLRTGFLLSWPEAEKLESLRKLIMREKITLLWRGKPDYPEQLTVQLGEHAPAWLWCAGSQMRLELPAVAMIGSRQTPPELQGAAHALAREIAGAGFPVVSGMAPGADAAAHAGALSAGKNGAGTIALPAKGIMQLDFSAIRSGGMTALGLGRPHAFFSAQLALARNDLIAAQARALVLVASDLTGGSCYAVDWARRHGIPIFCFECGKETPVANRHLIKAGVARPLEFSAATLRKAALWLPEIISAAEKSAGESDTKTARSNQLDFLNSSAAA